MTCYYPMQGYRSTELTKTGKRKIVFNRNSGFVDMPQIVPCGQCIGCRLDRSREWACRCVHEASLYDDNCFITLTYNDEFLPYDLSLNLDHFQKFMKRLRKRFGDGIRFYHCGEYGETTQRPHYHAILFNFDFKDKVLFKKTHDGQNLYVSESLSELWPFGFSTIGNVSFESAAYVARYVMKKVTGDNAVEHYQFVNQYGEVFDRKPEYTTMSRRPGIGKGWFDKFYTDIYPSDKVVLSNGGIMKPPSFYDSQYEILYPENYAQLKSQRIRAIKLFDDNCSLERLDVRRQVKESRLSLLKRTI